MTSTSGLAAVARSLPRFLSCSRCPKPWRLVEWCSTANSWLDRAALATSTAWLQRSRRSGHWRSIGGSAVTFAAFDLLFLDGTDLTGESYDARRKTRSPRHEQPRRGTHRYRRCRGRASTPPRTSRRGRAQGRRLVRSARRGRRSVALAKRPSTGWRSRPRFPQPSASLLSRPLVGPPSASTASTAARLRARSRSGRDRWRLPG